MITGYLIIDLQNVDLSNSVKTLNYWTKNESAYEKIESNIGKAILLTNIVIDNIERPNAFTHIVKVENNNFYLDYRILNDNSLNYYLQQTKIDIGVHNNRNNIFAIAIQIYM